MLLANACVRRSTPRGHRLNRRHRCDQHRHRSLLCARQPELTQASRSTPTSFSATGQGAPLSASTTLISAESRFTLEMPRTDAASIPHQVDGCMQGILADTSGYTTAITCWSYWGHHRTMPSARTELVPADATYGCTNQPLLAQWLGRSIWEEEPPGWLVT